MSSEGCGRFRRNTTVCASGASTASTLAYQSLRGLIRSLAGASGASRSTSNVNLTSFEVKGFPSCHFTSLRTKKTRLLKHGSDGKLVEYVDVSWTAKPWGRSSRSMTLRVPPGFGACAVAGPTPETATLAVRASPSATASRWKRLIVFPLLLIRPSGPVGSRPGGWGRPRVIDASAASQNIREAEGGHNWCTPRTLSTVSVGVAGSA